jgi:hypothetical protein
MANQSDEKKPADKAQPGEPGGDSDENIDSLAKKLTEAQRGRLRAKLQELTRGAGEGGALGATMETHSSHADNDGWF